jgi:hypothetical protein
MTTPPLDLAAIAAEHQPRTDTTVPCCSRCTLPTAHPCLPYLLAVLAQEQAAALVRVRALNDHFLELRDRTEGWNEATPLRVSPAEAFERCARAVRTAVAGEQS